jgi:hypothetical protein
MPGSRTDWLYRLIFREVGDLWEGVHSGDPEMGPPPDWLRVEELGGADWVAARCLGPVRRVWTFGPEGLHAQSGEEEAVAECGEARGVFWPVGLVRFHIAADRERLVFEYAVGPLYGSGMVLGVTGRGTSGRLCPAGPEWVS